MLFTDMRLSSCINLEGCYEADTMYFAEGAAEGGANFIDDVKNVKACQRECQKSAECNFWTYNSWKVENNKGRCFLSVGQGKVSQMAGKMSGPKVCPE